MRLDIVAGTAVLLELGQTRWRFRDAVMGAQEG
jgi:urease beta subunit